MSNLQLAIMSLSVVGGLGAILGVFIEMYGAEGVSTTHIVWLSTFPSLFVGVGKRAVDQLLVLRRRLRSHWWACKHHT